VVHGGNEVASIADDLSRRSKSIARAFTRFADSISPRFNCLKISGAIAFIDRAPLRFDIIHHYLFRSPLLVFS
jgi:hypothetical protein